MAEPTNLPCSMGRETSALVTVFFNRLEQSVLHIFAWHFQKEYILKQKSHGNCYDSHPRIFL